MDFDRHEQQAASLKRATDAQIQAAVTRWFVTVTIVVVIGLAWVLLITLRSAVGVSFLETDWLSYPLLCIIGVATYVIVHIDESIKSLSGIARRLENVPADVQRLKDILTNGLEFILYLRDYRSGRDDSYVTPITGSGFSGTANPLLWPRTYGKRSTSRLMEAFDALLPVVYLHSAAELTTFHGGIGVCPSDETWVQDFEELALHARYVVVDYDLRRYEPEADLTKNIRLEIDVIVRAARRNVILVGTPEALRLIEQHCPAIREWVACRCVIYAHDRLAEEFRIDLTPFLKLIG